MGNKNISIHKQDFFFAFCVYKNISHKIVHEWIFQCMPSAKDNVPIFIYKKNKTKCETIVYTKTKTLCKKKEKFPYVYIYKKHDTLRYLIFMKFLKLAFIYKNYDTLRYVTFLYTKIWTICKKQDNLRYVLYKIWTLSVTQFFIEFLKLVEEGKTF